MFFSGYLGSFLILFLIWSIIAVIAKLMKLDKKGITIFPLILVVRSNKFLEIIMSEAKKRKKFWIIVAKVSPFFIWLVLLLSVVYFIANLYFLLIGVLRVSGGIPVGTPLVPIIPFITVSGKFLLYLTIASAIAIIPHEIAHGVVAIKEGLDVKSTGFFFILGAILGAFVELPEEELIEINKDVQNIDKIKLKSLKKVLAAGIFFNTIMFTILYGVTLNYDQIMSPLFKVNGVEIVRVYSESPAEKAGLESGIVIVKINDTQITDIDAFLDYTDNIAPGDVLILYSSDGGIYVLKTSINPDNKERAYLGIVITNHYESKCSFIPDSLYLELFTFLYVFMLLQFVVIITNALPIFISDGAKYIFIFLREKLANRALADIIYLSINWLCLIMLLANFILPLLK